MATLPLDPVYARLLILSKDFHCTAEVGGGETSLRRFWTSSRCCRWRPSSTRRGRNERRRTCRIVASRRCMATISPSSTCSKRIGRFEEGISRREARGSQQWCYDNFINPRSMKTAMEIRKQLVGYCEKLGIGEAVGVSGRRDGRAAKASWTKCGGASLPACSFRSRRRSPRS